MRQALRCLLLCAFLSPIFASAQTSTLAACGRKPYVDWTTRDFSPRKTTGILYTTTGPITVTFNWTNPGNDNTGLIDASGYSAPLYTPAASGVESVRGTARISDGPITSGNITFSSPVTNPVFHFNGLDYAGYRFTNVPAGSGVMLSGNGIAVLGNSGGQLTFRDNNNSIVSSSSGCDNGVSICGSLQIMGTYSNISFVCFDAGGSPVDGHGIAIGVIGSATCDFGDAPNSYLTAGVTGAHHKDQASLSNPVRLGAVITTEGDAFVSPLTDGGDDGAAALAALSASSTSYSMAVQATNTTATPAVLAGWIDFNRNGLFDAGERTTATVPAGTTDGTVSLNWTSLSGLGQGSSWVRLRISTDALDTDATPGTAGWTANPTPGGDGRPLENGETEDLPITLNSEYDFGDAPVTYEATAGGITAVARQTPASTLTLGGIGDVDAAPASVAGGASNNGANGDGADEDAITPAPITDGAAFSLPVTVTNNTGTAKTLLGWIDFDNDGRFEATELAQVSVPAGTTGGPILISWTPAQTAATTVGNVYMRLRLADAVLSDDATTAAVDERAIGDGQSAGVYTNPSIGEIEDYQLAVVIGLDFGDAPLAYEANNAGTSLPARHLPLATLSIGGAGDVDVSPNTVAAGADNNGANGDGLDENGITVSTVTAGAAYTLSVTVSNTTGAAKVLHGWIDFDNNGRFELGELATANVNTAVTNGTVNLVWTAATTTEVTTPNVYLRLRLSDVALTDNAATTAVDERSFGDGVSSGVAGIASGGEIEDFRLSVVSGLDYGDAPLSYDNNNAGAYVPVRNTAAATLFFKTQPDTELTPQSVAAGANNNGANGDGTTDDGASPTAVVTGAAYTLPVNVANTSGAVRTVHGWIDFNNNGRFEASEYSSVNVANNNNVNTALNLVWTAAQTGVATTPNLYMRLRTTVAVLADNAATTGVDERAIGDGLSTGVYGTAAVGETEDYQLAVQAGFDFGDAPASYEATSTNLPLPARAIPLATLRLGSIPNTELTPNTVAAGADNNAPNGDGATDDGAAPGLISIGSTYALNVTVTNTTGAAETLHGWIDLDNNGIFEASEYQSVNVAGNANGITAILTWTTAQTNTIVSAPSLYMRLRLSSAALADGASVTVDERAIGDGLSTGLYGTPATGEVEDYRIEVAPSADFGDAPLSFDRNSANAYIPARQLPSATLRLGATVDVEIAPESVPAGADNTGTNGDGATDDGVAIVPVLVPGSSYALSVAVTNTLGARILHGWIDFNSNGRFELTEYQSVNTSASGNVTLTWTAAQTTGASTAIKYIRLRLANGALTNDNATGLVDERAIGDGSSTGLYNSILTGEVEDYSIAGATVNISGNVWNDANGNAVKTATEPFIADGSFWANLVNPLTNAVIGSVQTDASGNYTFNTALPNTAYRVVLTTTSQPAGTNLTAAVLPANWANTGVNLAGVPNTGNQTGIININTGAVGLANQNFGIEQLPTALNATASTQVNPGGANTVVVPALSGTDPEDGPLGEGATVVIATLPANAQLYYDVDGDGAEAGEQLGVGAVIPSYEAFRLLVDPQDGNQNVVFQYTIRDAAGLADLTPATVTMPFTAAPVTISGQVFADPDGDVVIDADELGTNLGSPDLTIYLVDGAGKVVASQPIGADGNYTFNDVPALQGFTLRLSNTPNVTVGATAPAASLPAGATVNTGESFGIGNTAGTGAELTTPGVITLTTGLGDVTGVNFGLENRPTAVGITVPLQTNPGDDQPNLEANTVVVPMLTGTDPEDGPLPSGPTSSIFIATAPDPATGVLYYNGAPLVPPVTITAYDPALLRLDPAPGSPSPNFDFSTVDKAGKTSLPATVSMSFVGYDYGDLDETLWPTAYATMPAAKVLNYVPVAWDAITNPVVAVWGGSGINSETATREGGNSVASLDGYDDAMVLPASITPGTAMTYSITLNANKAGTTVHYRLWFDWNGNGRFDDDLDATGAPASYSGSGVTAGPVTVPVSVTPPADASAAYNVRLIVSDAPIADEYRASLTGAEETIVLANGEVEDFFKATPLPVTLSQFYVQKRAASALLVWKTSSEHNSSHFVVERSADGRNFAALGRVSAGGNRSSESNYSFTDAAPLAGNNFYRLVMVDADGSSKTSPVRLLSFAANPAITLYPNPSTTTAELTGLEAGMRIVVLDGKGQQLRTEQAMGTTHTLATAAWSAGTYQVQIINAQGNRVKVLRLIKL